MGNDNQSPEKILDKGCLQLDNKHEKTLWYSLLQDLLNFWFLLQKLRIHSKQFIQENQSQTFLNITSKWNYVQMPILLKTAKILWVYVSFAKDQKFDDR